MRNKFFSDIYIIRRTKKQYLVYESQYASHCCISLINKTKKTNNLSRVRHGLNFNRWSIYDYPRSRE